MKKVLSQISKADSEDLGVSALFSEDTSPEAKAQWIAERKATKEDINKIYENAGQFAKTITVNIGERYKKKMLYVYTPK